MQNSNITESNKQKLDLTEELQHLKELIDAGKTDQIKELCQQNPGIVNAEIEIHTDRGGNILIPPLIYAIGNKTNNILETVRALIDCGANIQQENRSGDRVDGITQEIYNEPRTPLAYAFTTPENMPIVKLLISSPDGKEALKSFEENASWTCNKYFITLLKSQEQKGEVLELFSKKSLNDFIYMQLIELSTVPDYHELMTQLHDNIFNKKSIINQHCIQKLRNTDSHDNGYISLQRVVTKDNYNSYKTLLAMGLDNYLSTSDQTQVSNDNAIILHALFDKSKYSKIGETNWKGLYNKICPTIKEGRKLTTVDMQDMLKMIPNTWRTDAYFFNYLRKKLLEQYTCDEPSFFVQPLMHKIPDLAKIITTNPKATENLSDIFDVIREDITLPSLHDSENNNEIMLESPPEEKHSEHINIITNIAEEQIDQNPGYLYNIILELSGCDNCNSWV